MLRSLVVATTNHGTISECPLVAMDTCSGMQVELALLEWKGEGGAQVKVSFMDYHLPCLCCQVHPSVQPSVT